MRDLSVADLLRAILRELRGLRADIRRSSREAPDLVAAIADELGEARFTAAGVLGLGDEDRQSTLAIALSARIDMDASQRSRATALGALLRRLPQIETVAEQRGCAVYRLRTSSAEVREVRSAAR